MKKAFGFIFAGLMAVSLLGCSTTQSLPQTTATPTPVETVEGQGNTPGNSMNKGYMTEGESPYYFCVEPEGIMQINHETGEKTIYAKANEGESFCYLNWVEDTLYALLESPDPMGGIVGVKSIVSIQPSGERQEIEMPDWWLEPISFSTAGGAIYVLTGDSLLQISIKPENYGEAKILAEPKFETSRMTTGVPIANEEVVYYIGLNQQTNIGQDVTYRQLDDPETQGPPLTGMNITKFFVQGNDLYAYEADGGGKDVYKIDLETGEKQAMGFAENTLEEFNICGDSLYYILRDHKSPNLSLYKRSKNGEDTLLYSIPALNEEELPRKIRRPCRLYEIYGDLYVYDVYEKQVYYVYQPD